MKFRIKIDERHNGEKVYQPQVREFLLFGWKNIITNGSKPFTSSLISCAWPTEEGALEEIEIYKKFLIDMSVGNGGGMNVPANTDLLAIRDEILAALNQFLYLLTLH